MIDQNHTLMTAVEYLALPETTRFVELINAKLVVSPLPLVVHQQVGGEILLWLSRNASDGDLFPGPIGVYFDDKNIVEPDIVWVAENSRCKIGEKLLEGPPDLIVEILSPSTARNDKIEKFQLYEKFGVQEYWIIDPIHKLVEVWLLDGGQYVLQGVYGVGDSFMSAALGGKAVDVKLVFGG